MISAQESGAAHEQSAQEHAKEVSRLEQEHEAIEQELFNALLSNDAHADQADDLEVALQGAQESAEAHANDSNLKGDAIENLHTVLSHQHQQHQSEVDQLTHALDDARTEHAAEAKANGDHINQLGKALNQHQADAAQKENQIADLSNQLKSAHDKSAQQIDDLKQSVADAQGIQKCFLL